MKHLSHLRNELDLVSKELIFLLAKRKDLTKQIAEVKKEKNIPIDDPSREQTQIQFIRRLAIENGLDSDVVQKLFEIFINYCKEEMKQP